MIDRKHEGETRKSSQKHAVRTALEEAITHSGQERKRQQRSGVERVALHELFYAHSEDRCFKQQHAEERNDKQSERSLARVA